MTESKKTALDVNDDQFVYFNVVYDNACVDFWDGTGADVWAEIAGSYGADNVTLSADDARVAFDRLRACDGWVDGIDAPIYFEVLPSFREMRERVARLYAGFAFDAYNDQLGHGVEGWGIYLNKSGEPEICHDTEWNKGAFMIDLSNLDGLDPNVDGEQWNGTREDYVESLLGFLVDGVADPVADAYNDYLDGLCYRELTIEEANE